MAYGTAWFRRDLSPPYLTGPVSFTFRDRTGSGLCLTGMTVDTQKQPSLAP